MDTTNRWVKLVLFIIALSVSAGLYLGLRQGFIRGTDSVNILVMGIDTGSGWQARSDSINLIHIDFARNRMGVLAIPRDTLVKIPGYGEDKINHAHVFGGPELSCLTVSKFLGIPIDNYIEVNFPMFTNMIDQLGGVSLDVEKPLYYDDYAGGLHVRLDPGLQKLSGYDAMGYVRFRHDRASDWGRIERQHKFISAVASELMAPANVMYLPSIIFNASKNVRTNLEFSQILKIAMRVPGIFKYGKVDMGFIPGGDARIEGGYYMLSDKDEMRKVIDKVIYGKNVD